MFIHNIDPVLFRIFGLEVRYYGLVYAFYFIASNLLLVHLAKNNKIKNFDEKKADILVLLLVITGVAGARIFYFIVAEPSIFITDPLELFKLWHGGMSFYGGFLGILIAGYFYCKKYEINLLEILDALFFLAPLALALGRLANFANSELWGKVTDVSWCVKFPSVEGCRHPYQIYASISHFITFGILLFFWNNREKKGYRAGTIFYHFLWLYGGFRFLTDFYRDDAPLLFGLSLGQYVSLLMFLIGIILLNKDKLRDTFIKKHSHKSS